MDSIPFEMEGYELVRAVGEDMDYVLECVREDILNSVPPDEKDLRDLWIDDVLQIASDSIEKGTMRDEVFRLVSGGENAGMLWMGVSRDQFTCDETGYLLGIFVRKDLRRKGLGKELMRAAERWCRTNGLTDLTLNVGASNECAKGLYRRMGYSERSTVMRRMLR